MSVDDFWPEFGKGSAPQVTCAGGGGLAGRVLSTYGIPYAGAAGGDLPDLDIKHMDAIQVIKLSLLEESANSGQIIEPIMNAEGQVEFVTIGTGGGVSDIYYEIQSGSYKEECSGVMVIGQDPPAYRKKTEWNPVWGQNRPDPMDVGWLYSSCNKSSFNQYCTLVYNDPHLDSSYKDGITNLYEINEGNPWDTITGYAHYFEWEGWESDSDTVITMSDSARILVQIPEVDLGTLRTRPTADKGWGEDPACWDGTSSEDPEGGVAIPMDPNWRYATVRGTQVDKFAGVNGVYILGLAIDDLRGVPIDDSASNSESPSSGDAYISVSIKKTEEIVFKLIQGQHYVIAYESIDPAEPVIVFANNIRIGEVIEFAGSGVDYRIDPNCEFAQQNPTELSGNGVILPTSANKGLLVNQIFVGIDLETPSILVFNPQGSDNKARTIAEGLTYDLMPIVTTDEPAPIAFNGTLINQEDAIADHDPTTTQNLEDTELEQALAAMDAGGGMTLTLSFLDEGQVQNLSGALYDYMNSGDGVESTYVCGPNCNPDLGGTGPNGGIINSITYSYQDSNSYTVSVNCGSYLVGGMSQVTGGPSPKVAESFSAKGTVIQDKGDNEYYKVRVDGFKDVFAINMCPKVIRVGDKVNVSIHNNPVEE